MSGLALEANLSENTLKHLYKRKTYPTLQTLCRISTALGYPPWQFLAFDNKAYALSAQERELLNAYNRLSPRHRELLLHNKAHSSFSGKKLATSSDIIMHGTSKTPAEIRAYIFAPQNEK